MDERSLKEAEEWAQSVGQWEGSAPQTAAEIMYRLVVEVRRLRSALEVYADDDMYYIQTGGWQGSGSPTDTAKRALGMSAGPKE